MDQKWSKSLIFLSKQEKKIDFLDFLSMLRRILKMLLNFGKNTIHEKKIDYLIIFIDAQMNNKDASHHWKNKQDLRKNRLFDYFYRCSDE